MQAKMIACFNHQYGTVAFKMLLFCCLLAPSSINAQTQNSLSKPDNLDKRFIYHPDATILDSHNQRFLRKLASTLHLPELLASKNRLAVRIWLWGDVKKYIVTIKRNQSRNECRVLSWNSERTDTGEYLIIHSEKDYMPKSGWAALFIAIKKFRITSLKSGRIQYQVRRSVTHSAYIQFEIIKQGKGRFYEYLEPDIYQDIDPDSRAVHRFLLYLNRQIGKEIYTF